MPYPHDREVRERCGGPPGGRVLTVKVLVLARSTGEGHNRVSQALQQAFEARGHECLAADALGIVDRDLGAFDSSEPPADLAQAPAGAARPANGGLKKRTADVASQLYGWSALKVPALFGAVFNLGIAYSRARIPSPIRLYNARYAEATRQYIEDNEYDAVVAVHLFPEATLSSIRRNHPSRARFYGVLTDYTYTPFFSEPKLDGYFIPHPDMMAAQVRAGLPERRTFAEGIPVSGRFRQRRNRAEARTRLGLPQDLPIFLVMSGGVGSLQTAKVCDLLLSRGSENMHLVVQTGRREDLFTKIASRFRDDPRVSVVPFTEQIPSYMAAADVLVSKPGAVTSTEAAVVGLPLVHTAAIPGLEGKNARFFADRGMSYYVKQVDDATRVAHLLVQNQAAMEQMRRKQAKNIIPDGAERIVRRIENDIR